MSQTIVALPRFIQLRSEYNHKFLLVKEGAQEYVKFEGENLSSPEAKFEVHSSKNGNGLVHIRSCYNNKYLGFKERGFGMIAAGEEKPNEYVKSRNPCTLLRPYSVDGDLKNIRLTHLRFDLDLCFSKSRDAYFYGCVELTDKKESFFTLFSVIAWEPQVILPNYVAFKGDNDKFLRCHGKGDHDYLQFGAENMEDNPTAVGHEILQMSSGNILIRSLNTEHYWRATPGWIWPDSKNPTDDIFTEFKPVKIDDITIALKNVATNKFCKRLTTEGKEDCLDAGPSAIDKWSKLKVSELVISRKIENVNFRLMDARIYGESVNSLDTLSYINETSAAQEATFKLSYKNKTSNTWNWQVSAQVNIETTFQVGIPRIEEGEVKLGVQFGYMHSRGETEEEGKTHSYDYTVSVPPMKKWQTGD
ncbi:uncharacterized protein LOC141721733 [Apium graveolens]|uniref:uncharacterized protein LOC141721733 n=1 Tax=Apium graveolens TaxID=4045 RepID=UPI003D7AC44A